MDRATLEKYKHNRKEILQLAEEIKNLCGDLAAPAVQKMTGMPITRGGVSDPTGNGATTLADLCNFYQQRIKELWAQQLEIEKAIDKLDGDLKIIIRYRYISGYKWEDICERMADEDGPMDAVTVHRRHRKALEKLAEIA